MLHSRLSVVSLLALTISAPIGLTKHLCTGFLPENDMKIPISAFQVGGVSQAEYNEVLDKVEAHYTPIFSSKGASLKVNRAWSDDQVNASANQMGRTWVINMYGGLARHPVMTKDGLLMVACHEIGHHIGGAPKVDGWFGPSWATNEGNSDYFASLRCMRDLFPAEENAKWVMDHPVDPVARQKCEEIYSTQDEENLCMRSAMAGMIGGLMFKAMRNESATPAFNTPDTRIVSRMDDDHPDTQCRLDTYYQGALCFHDRTVALSDTNPNTGTCTIANGNKDGLRPLCWFKP